MLKLVWPAMDVIAPLSVACPLASTVALALPFMVALIDASISRFLPALIVTSPCGVDHEVGRAFDGDGSVGGDLHRRPAHHDLQRVVLDGHLFPLAVITSTRRTPAASSGTS